MKEIYSELDFVYICSDGKKFVTENEAKEHEKALKEPKLFGRIGNEN